MITAATLLQALEKLPTEDPVLEVHVSSTTFSQLCEATGKVHWLGDSGIFATIRLVVDQYYQPEWWSEHYRNKVIFHGDTTFEMHGANLFVEGRNLLSRPLQFNVKEFPFYFQSFRDRHQ